ncbi:TcpQ domain-containing protein [Paraburkholderia fungorum]|uniref:TcpQ domain-containing protein n=1 Tax=Paraburkholderia fungorum TaxID=134537 RepID=UPI00402B71D1
MKMKLSCAVAVVALGTAATANAAFVVNDDAPLITAANPQGPKRDSTTTLSFSGTRLSRGGRATLDGLTSDVAAADSINLTAYVKSKSLMTNAKRRVATVKDWLVAHGVPESKVDIYTEIDPEDDAADTDVQITTRTKVRPAPGLASTGSVMPAVLDAAGQQQTQRQPASSGLSERERIEFARRVMAMAQAKIISGDDAIRLVNDFLNGQGTQTAPAPAAPVTQQLATATPPVVGGPIATAQPAQYSMGPIAAMQPQIVPASEVLRSWTLTANRSLRDNLEDWAQQAGYAKPTWSASIPYQITYTSNYSGTFLQVLAQIAQAVPGLDFKVSKAQHTIAVVDAQH